MKFARREGAQLFLVTLGHAVRTDMLEHSDLVLNISVKVGIDAIPAVATDAGIDPVEPFPPLCDELADERFDMCASQTPGSVREQGAEGLHPDKGDMQ
jgi:hypothetical protein